MTNMDALREFGVTHLDIVVGAGAVWRTMQEMRGA